LVAKKTHAIQRKNPNIHQLLKKKKKKTVGNQTVWECKKKKKQRERELQ
jgi:microcompartment protein CcmL/EutN